MTGDSASRLSELLAIVPEWRTRDVLNLIGECGAWKDDEPCPSDPKAFRVRLVATVGELDQSINAVKDLITEWGAASRKPATYARGKAQLEVERRAITEAQTTLRAALTKVNRQLRETVSADPIGDRMRALRLIDNAVELWRDDNSRAQEILATIDEALDDFYGEGLLDD